MVAGIKEKESVHDGDKDDVKRPVEQSLVEQSFMRSWDCTQIVNEEEEESWRERDHVAAQWIEEQKLEEILEQRRIEGDSSSWRSCERHRSKWCMNVRRGAEERGVPKRRNEYQNGLLKK